MTLEKDDIGIFQSELIAEREVHGMIFHLYANRVFHVQVMRYMKITTDMLEEGYKFIQEHGGGQFYNIFQFDSFSDVEPEVRDWAADKEGNLNTYTDAIVIGSLPQKIIADFYLVFNRPVKPTKVFFSLERAIDWTLEQKAIHEEKGSYF